MCSGHGAKFLRPGRRRSQVSGARSVIPCPASTSAADSSPDRRTPSTMSGCRISAAPCDLLVASVWNWRFCFLMLFVTVNAFAASLCGAAAARFDFHQTPLAPVIPGAGRPRRRRKSGSHRTPRWREMDSNHRYRIRNNPFWLPPFGPAIRLLLGNVFDGDASRTGQFASAVAHAITKQFGKSRIVEDPDLPRRKKPHHPLRIAGPGQRAGEESTPARRSRRYALRMTCCWITSRHFARSGRTSAPISSCWRTRGMLRHDGRRPKGDRRRY